MTRRCVSKRREKNVGFWATSWGMTAHPWRALSSLTEDPAALKRGLDRTRKEIEKCE
jgi:hypothetical protein